MGLRASLKREEHAIKSHIASPCISLMACYRSLESPAALTQNQQLGACVRLLGPVFECFTVADYSTNFTGLWWAFVFKKRLAPPFDRSIGEERVTRCFRCGL